MELITNFKIGPFVEYNHIWISQISSSIQQDLVIPHINEDVDIFKHIILESTEDKRLLFIYCLMDEKFYEIKFAERVCSYSMIQNHLLITIGDKKFVKRAIFKLSEGRIFYLNKIIDNIPFMLNMDVVLDLISDSSNYKECIDNGQLTLDSVLSSKLRENIRTTTHVFDFKNKKVFEINDNCIKDLAGGNKYNFDRRIIDCFNMTDTELLVVIEGKKGIKYYMMSKEDGSYNIVRNIGDIIKNLSNYYDLVRESIFVEGI